jgi:hypothetical protein
VYWIPDQVGVRCMPTVTRKLSVSFVRFRAPLQLGRSCRIR